MTNAKSDIHHFHAHFNGFIVSISEVMTSFGGYDSSKEQVLDNEAVASISG